MSAISGNKSASEFPTSDNNHPLEIPEIRRERTPTISPNLFRRLDFLESDVEGDVSFHSGSQKRSGLKLALWSWFSAFIDTLVLISTCCFFMVLAAFVMKATPTSMLAVFLKNQNLFYMLGSLFLATVWGYLIFMRAFMGASIGEWTCDLRLGEPVQRFHFSYIIKVFIRTTVIMASGIVVLPLLSLLLSRDLAGEISGLKIYSLQ